MDKDKTIIIYNSVKYFLPFFNQKGIKAYPVYKEVGFLSQILRKVFGYLGLNRYYWYGEWKNQLSNTSVSNVVIFANDEDDIWNTLRNRGLSIIFWYWNPTKIYSKALPINLPKEFMPYSFDPEDCKEFKMEFNTTFYFNNIELPVRQKKYEILFVGMDKGRKSQLEDFRLRLKELNISNLIYIVSNRNFLGKHAGNKPIGYSQYLKYISESNAILDLIQDRQSGLTLRAMESIFFSKKLITNDLTIVNQQFYNENNVFIIGKDKLEDLKEFVRTPYLPLETSIVEYYDVNNWLTRFSIN
ncbi:hypothetical protein [Sphingobacterium sp.]|uniref:hypothetical protein n=1 Tax=Sphingobacterium sp. TaxID=341027 RepID=UPI0028A26BD8|nr:hypothetical protein [Sphingobacterium sp.]